MDSVVLVPVAMLAEPVIAPVDSSRNAQPKKLVLTGGWIAAGSAGAASLGADGGQLPADRRYEQQSQQHGGAEGDHEGHAEAHWGTRSNCSGVCGCFGETRPRRY